jgi:hypothetical protein
VQAAIIIRNAPKLKEEEEGVPNFSLKEGEQFQPVNC